MGALSSSEFGMVSGPSLTWIECTQLGRFPWLLHAFSTRLGGASKPPAAGLNLGNVEWDQPSTVDRNRSLFLRERGAEDFSLATLHQVHSARAYRVISGTDGTLEYRPAGRSASESLDSATREGDALLTLDPHVLLAVRTADCMPILLADPKRRAVAAVHAGWRGALEGVIRKAVEEMRRALGSHPPDLVAAVGPFIHACCYEVGEEVVEVFHRRFPEAQGFFRGMPELDRRKCYLDLGRVARDELLHTGVSPSNILITDFCTSCRTDLFFSHRKEQGRTGRMMAIIGIRKQSYTERHKL